MLKGILFVLAGAALFSIKAILVKIGYQQGMDGTTLLTLRMAFALPFFITMAFMGKTSKVSLYTAKTHWKEIFFLALLGYYLSSYFDFMGLKYINAGMERLIVFTYPTMVVVLSAIYLKQSITQKILISLFFTYLGIGLIFLNKETESNPNLYWGSFLVFASAFCYAVYLVGSNKLITKIGSFHYTAYVMSVSCLIMILHFFINKPTNIFHLNIAYYQIGILLAILTTVIPTFLLAEGIKIIGASKTALVASIGPVVTIFLGYWILNETISEYEILGTLLVISGVLWISIEKRNKVAL